MSFKILLPFIQAQAKNEELRKQPERMILSEVRQVVQQMQTLNQHLEEAVSFCRKIL
jgi:DNA-binding transcriptional regulator YhcF (GntR family)